MYIIVEYSILKGESDLPDKETITIQRGRGKHSGSYVLLEKGEAEVVLEKLQRLLEPRRDQNEEETGTPVNEY